MRILNILRNSIWAISSFIFISLLTIYVRKLFTQHLQINLLGLEGLFSNIVSILSLAEMGVANVISYSLYKAIAIKNYKEINDLMNIYRYVYAIIAIIVFLLSIGIYFSLPYIIHDNKISWFYIELVYFIQVGIVLTTYLLAYKRTLFIAGQQEYICIKIDTICKTLNNLVRVIAIVLFQSYVMYAISALFFNILSNLLISRKVNRVYPFFQKYKISSHDLLKYNFFSDIRNFMIHKLSYIVYSGIDTIIVSYFLGLEMAGILSNYILIHTGVYAILYKMLQGIIPSIGNLIYSENKEKSFEIYKLLDLIYSFIAGYICCVYVIAMQSFVELFFGINFLLPNLYVYLLALSVFLGMQFENAYNYRSTYGQYENDKKYMILAAMIKLIAVIFLVKNFGIVGLVLSSIMGLLFIIFGRIKFVFKIIFKRNIKDYLAKHLKFSFVVMCEILFLSIIFQKIEINLSYFNLLFQCLISFVFMMIIQYGIYRKNNEFKLIHNYIKNIKNRFLGGQ